MQIVRYLIPKCPNMWRSACGLFAIAFVATLTSGLNVSQSRHYLSNSRGVNVNLIKVVIGSSIFISRYCHPLKLRMAIMID